MSIVVLWDILIAKKRRFLGLKRQNINEFDCAI